jgi:hypothetical protein
VGDPKTFAVNRIEIAPVELVGRRIGDGVDQNVEAIPVRCQAIDERIDLAVFAGIEG